MSSKRIVLVAGEASGDHHAAKLVKALSAQYPDLSFSGIGGQSMRNAGVNTLHDLAQFGVVGTVEVLRHFKDIHQAYSKLKQHLSAQKPDLLILIDYPGFNLKISKFARSLNIPILYYISPQLWAWKAKRIDTIKQCVSRMAVILPFEKAIYQKANVPVDFVGHPLSDSVPKPHDDSSFRLKHGIAKKARIIGLVPGSRQSEIKNLLPILLQTAKKLAHEFDDLDFILPIASNLKKQLFQSLLAKTELKIHVIENDFYSSINACHSVMVASGTASLEVALMNKPMAIVYKTSMVSYAIAMQVVKIKYLGLCNLLANKMVVPELLQNDLNAENLFQVMRNYLIDDDHYHFVQQELVNVSNGLAGNSIDMPLTHVVRQMLSLESTTRA